MTKRIFTTEDFIAKAKEIHGDKFLNDRRRNWMLERDSKKVI